MQLRRLDADPQVGGEQQEGAGGDAWPLQAASTGVREAEDALAQRRPPAYSISTISSGCVLKDLEIEPGGADTLAAG